MKVHFADSSNSSPDILYEAGVRYALISFYHIKQDRPLMLPPYKHVIIDSGLFTLMFGKEKGNELTEDKFEAYAWSYMRFISMNPPEWTYVELDIQKKFGVEAAWEWRERFRKELEGRDIMNVYHLEDGSPDRLIAFSDYIAVSIPELRIHCSKRELIKIVSYIATKASNVGKRVHLLGCTQKDLLQKFKHLYSCDSTSWIALMRYGTGKHPDLGKFSLKMMRVDGEPIQDKRVERRMAVIAALDMYNEFAGPQN